jgi:hypothetical protein
MDIQVANNLDEHVAVLDDRLPEPETDVARVAWSAIRDYVRARYGLSDEVIQLLSDESLESGRFNEFLSYIDSVRAYADLVDSATSWLVADVLVALYDREKARLERLSGASVSESDVLESILNHVGPIYGISSVETAYQYYHLARRFPADKRLPGKTFRFIWMRIVWSVRLWSSRVRLLVMVSMCCLLMIPKALRILCWILFRTRPVSVSWLSVLCVMWLARMLI